jgi:thiol-disulfide isomerase/thioredoxin
MTFARSGLVLAVFVAVVTPASPAADVSPEARTLLDASAKAYRGLANYADHGAIQLKVLAKTGQPATTRTVASKVALSRPNKVAIDAGIVRVGSDGKLVRTTIPPLAMYRDTPAPARLTLADFADGPLGALQFSGPQGRPLHVILGFLFADDPVKEFLADAKSVTAVVGMKLDGKANDMIVYEPQVGPGLNIWIDPTSKLITRIAVLVRPKNTADRLVPGSSLEVESLTWSAGVIETGSLPASTFELTKPGDYKEIAALAKDVAKKKAEHELIGQPAPDFTLNVLDGPGKMRRVTNADLVGKVVLIDFWATWCGPCLVELPDVAAMVAEYAKDKKPVVVVALSIDESEDGDATEVRKLVEKTMDAKGLKLDVPPVGIVALDPSQAIARIYKANAIPQLVLIDAKGVVRHVHIGVTEREQLTEEVDAVVAEAAKM